MGKWVYSPESIDKQPKRGDFRPICGVLDTPDYIAFYLNIGNGFILYEYTEKTKTKPVWHLMCKKKQKT